MTPEQQEAYEERAAIREHDGELPREEAERLAREDVMGEGVTDTEIDAINRLVRSVE